MNWLSEHPDRRRSIRVPVVLGWVFVLVAMVVCCPLTSGRPASAHHAAAAAATAPRITPAAPASAVRAVVAVAPDDRGSGSSCHGASEHSAPVLLPGQPAPASPPSAAATLPAAPLTGGAVIRGPSNDTVADVDHLLLQVQRI